MIDPASTLHKLFAAQKQPLPEIEMTLETPGVDEAMDTQEGEGMMEIDLPPQSCTLLRFWGRTTGHERREEGDMDLDIGLGIEDVMQCS